MSEPMTEDDLAAIEGMLSAGAIEVRYGREYDPSIVRALVAEVRRLREERRGMVAESSWDELADELTEVEADNARLRAALTEQRDAALSETVDCYNCCDGCPMDAEDYPGWLTAPWALIGDNRE